MKPRIMFQTMERMLTMTSTKIQVLAVPTEWLALVGFPLKVETCGSDVTPMFIQSSRV